MIGAPEIAEALGGRRVGREYRGWCPVHEADRHGNPSLTWRDDDAGKVLLKCWGGCSNAVVVDALKHMGLWPESEKPLSHSTHLIKPAKDRLSRTAHYALDVLRGAKFDDPVVAAHAYADRKRIGHAFGAGRAVVSGCVVGRDADCIVVPIRLGGVGEPVAMQAISTSGAKQTFGQLGDAFLLLGDERDPRSHWFVCEGWATAYAFHRLYRPAVTCISFGKGRLAGVAGSVTRLFAPARLVIAEEFDT